MWRKVGNKIRIVHDAVDRMEKLGIEFAGRGVVDLGPFHGAVIHEAQIGVHGEVGERVRRGSQPIEELLQMMLGNVSLPRAGTNDERQRYRQVLAGAAGDGLQVFDEFHPIRFPRLHPQPFGGETLDKSIRGARVLGEPVQGNLSGPSADIAPTIG